ncbi:MAG: hypothetical protein KatS3mg034_0594 [Vicingaceae bacterium]|nr:MAG: hypothetical protein KatS3mg034_0594 [Vicingaceae bacterium]
MIKANQEKKSKKKFGAYYFFRTFASAFENVL